jgi:hypothetical protein
VPFASTHIDRPDAMSVKLALTAEDRMVVPATKVFTMAKTPEPLKGI